MKTILKTILLLGLAAPFFFIDRANAQSRSDWRDILVRVAELEGQVEVLKRNAATVGAGNLESGQQALLADMEIRIGRLEAEIRTLTGQIEEIAYNQTRIERDIDLFRRDVELRFQDLSTGGALQDLAPDQSAEPEPERQEAEVQAASVLPTVTLPEGSEAEQYDFAFSFLRRSDFPSAEAAFKAFLEAHPTHALAGNAQYWLGETYYVRQDYPKAAAAFLKGFQTYGDGAKGPDSLLKLGMSLSSMNQNQQACSAFEELLSRYVEAGDAILGQARRQQERLGCL